MRRWTAVAAAGLVIALTGLMAGGTAAEPSATSAAAPERVFFANKCSNAAFRPRAIYTCGSGGFFITNARWFLWNRERARGRGKGHINDCMPDCATGTLHKGRLKVQLFRPRLCAGDDKWHFTRLRFRWIGGPPQGIGPRRGQIPYFCSLVGP